MSDRSPPTRLGLRQQIHGYYVANHRDWHRPGFRALAVHRFGQWRKTLRFRPARALMTFLYRRLQRYCTNVYGIEIPDGAKLGRRIVFEHQHGIIIHWRAVIGDDCVIRQGVTIGNKSRNHPDDVPVLGCGVDIGAGAKILGKVHIGDHACIGANAVVVRDVPAGATAVGIPARLLPTGRSEDRSDSAVNMKDE